MVVAVVVVAVIFIGVVIAALSYSPPQPTLPGFPGGGGGSVEVTEVTVSSPDNACGLDGATQAGFASPHLPIGVTWLLPANGAPLPCTVSTVSTDTPGFGASANVTLTVTAGDTLFPVGLYYPTSFNGPLHLIIN